MYIRGLLQLFSLPFVLSKRHVILNTPKLRQQGYSADIIDVGEVIAEAPAYSRENCVALCQATPVCRSVMLVGQLCRMFAPSTCPCFAELTHVAGSSRYLVGEDASVNSFTSAMDKCLSLGAHSVHINSQEEHELLKDYIRNSGVACRMVWTGGRAVVAWSSELSDWRCYYTNDANAASKPLTYISWGYGQPNNYGGDQYSIVMDSWFYYRFNDLQDMFGSTYCYMCECP